MCEPYMYSLAVYWFILKCRPISAVSPDVPPLRAGPFLHKLCTFLIHLWCSSEWDLPDRIYLFKGSRS